MPSMNGTAAPSTLERIEVRPLNWARAQVRIVGRSELIVHAWSEKARLQLAQLDARRHPLGLKPKNPPRDPDGDFQRSMYRLPDGRHAFPAVAFKAAIIGGCRMFDRSVAMSALKANILVVGEGDEMLVPLDLAGEPRRREDMVRLDGPSRAADIRWRAGYWPWAAVLLIEYNADILTADSLINLVDAGGYGGVGEWRPSAPKSVTGIYGRFQVARAG